MIEKGKDIPVFKLNAHALENSKVLKALCSLETRDVSDSILMIVILRIPRNVDSPNILNLVIRRPLRILFCVGNSIIEIFENYF